MKALIHILLFICQVLIRDHLIPQNLEFQLCSHHIPLIRQILQTRSKFQLTSNIFVGPIRVGPLLFQLCVKKNCFWIVCLFVGWLAGWFSMGSISRDPVDEVVNLESLRFFSLFSPSMRMSTWQIQHAKITGPMMETYCLLRELALKSWDI